MRVLGVDPGLQVTGYALLDGTSRCVRVVEAGVVRSTASDPLTRRLAAIHEGIAELLAAHRPEVLVLEELYAHYGHPTTAILMGHARGVICLAAASAGVPVIGYLPTRIKKVIVGRGHATKVQMQRMMQHHLSLPRLPEPSDVADALALALAHLHLTEIDQHRGMAHQRGAGGRRQGVASYALAPRPTLLAASMEQP